MYNGKRARFSKGAIGSAIELTKTMFLRYINPTNLLRLQKTLDLSDVSDEKPSINGVMVPIAERLDEEERQAELRKCRVYGWPHNMIYDCMGEDDYLRDSEGIILNPKHMKKINKKTFGKSNKRGSRGKGKKKDYDAQYVGYEDYDDYWENRKSMYTHGEWSEDNEDNYEESCKSIKFYPDITNEMSVIEFSSLKGFSDYCDEHGYVVGATDYENLKNWSTVHCCLDPIDLEYGEYAIITDTSYGGLYWTVEADLPDDVKHPDLVSSGIESRTLTD